MAIAAVTQAFGIREYMYRALPDLGFGGSANQISTNPLNGRVAACGYARTSGGNIVSYEWDFDYNGNALTGLGGPNSEAEDISHDPTNGLVRIVGCAQNASSIWKGVLWREQANGSFSTTVLPTLGGLSGDARCRVENTLGFVQNVRSFMGGWGQTSGGAERAELFVEMGSGAIMPIDLGTGGGPRSYVNDVALTMDGMTPTVQAFGATQVPGGAWQACQWVIQENAFATGWDVLILVLAPGVGISSEATGCGPNTIAEIPYCGNVGYAGGLTRAWMRMSPNQAAQVITFPASHFGEFNRSSSHAIARTFGGAMTVGEVHNDGEIYAGFVNYAWDLDNDGVFGGDNEQNCRLARELCPPNGSPPIRELCGITNAAIDEGLWYLCGSSWVSPSSFRPCVLEPENRHMPDYLAKPNGESLDESMLWFVDKRFLSNSLSRSVPSVPPLEVHFYELGDTATHEVGHFRATIRGLGRNSSGTLNIMAYRHDTHTYATLQSVQVTGQVSAISVPVDTGTYVDPVERDACFKITFTPNNGSTIGYASDFMDYTDD